MFSNHEKRKFFLLPGHPWDEKGLPSQKKIQSISENLGTKNAFRLFAQPLVLFLRQFNSECYCLCLHKDMWRHTKHAEASLY